jgi:flagellar hook-length control protein FliK
VKTAATSGTSDATPSPSDPPTTTTSAGTTNNNVPPQPAAATTKQETGNNTADTTKAEASAGASSAAISGHEHSLTAATGHTITDSLDAGAQAAGAIQPQAQSVALAAAPAGPLSVTAATNAAVPLSGLALEIAVSARRGNSRFEIRLDPADLGRIDVRIDVDRSGQVTSHLTVEKPETLSLLRQDVPQLQQALNDAGLKTGSGGLQFSLRDQSSSGQNNGNNTGNNAHRLIVSEEDAIPAAIAGRTYGRLPGSNSGVDIRV